MLLPGGQIDLPRLCVEAYYSAGGLLLLIYVVLENVAHGAKFVKFGNCAAIHLAHNSTGPEVPRVKNERGYLAFLQGVDGARLKVASHDFFLKVDVFHRHNVNAAQL